MNTNSHAHMAVLLHRRLKETCGINLPKRAFIVANCRPDYSIRYKKIPHYKKDMYQNIQAMVRDLAFCDKSKLNAYLLANRLGVICHYICDFFCYAHTERFEGTMKDHFQYEAGLNGFIKRYKWRIFKSELVSSDPLEEHVQEIWRQVDLCYEDYINQPPSYAADVTFSLKACEKILAGLLHIIVCKSQLSGRRLAEQTV